MSSKRGAGAPRLVRAWGVGDCVLFVVGSMVGTGIYLSAGNAWKMPGYPWIPALYVGSSVVFAVTIAFDAPKDALRGAVVLAAGVGVYLWEGRRRRARKSV